MFTNATVDTGTGPYEAQILAFLFFNLFCSFYFQFRIKKTRFAKISKMPCYGNVRYPVLPIPVHTRTETNEKKVKKGSFSRYRYSLKKLCRRPNRRRRNRNSAIIK